MRAGGEKRGNVRDRARRRAWLLEHFDEDLGPRKARCHLNLSSVCAGTLTAATLTVDRIEPSGSYARDNIRPACSACQHTQGALITNERRRQWLGWMQEAEAAGVPWDGTL